MQRWLVVLTQVRYVFLFRQVMLRAREVYTVRSNIAQIGENITRRSQ